MKKLIYALLISLIVFAAPSFAAPNWKYIGADDGNKWYIDINSICSCGMWSYYGFKEYTTKIVPGGAGKNAFNNYYGQPVASIIDQWHWAENEPETGNRPSVYGRKVYNTSGKLIAQEQDPTFFGDSKSSRDSIEKVLKKYVHQFCISSKMYEKRRRAIRKHPDALVNVYSTGKVEWETVEP